MKEEWKGVEGFDGNYLVSNYGKVLSLKRKKPIVLKVDNTRKYSCVTLSDDSKLTRIFIHRLVAIAFVENPEDKPQVNHIDGDKFNNRQDNLEWVTQSENQLHACKTGLQGIGQYAYGSKRTDEQIHEVCSLIQEGLVRNDILARCPYMSKAVFDNIRCRRRWTHISEGYVW
jgi:hypothetical protein